MGDEIKTSTSMGIVPKFMVCPKKDETKPTNFRELVPAHVVCSTLNSSNVTETKERVSWETKGCILSEPKEGVLESMESMESKGCFPSEPKECVSESMEPKGSVLSSVVLPMRMKNSDTIDTTRKKYESPRGRGRCQGRGRERFTSRDQNRENKDRSQVLCFRYDKRGHFALVYLEKKKRLEEIHKVEVEENYKNEEGTDEEALYVHEIVPLNKERYYPPKDKKEDGYWYLDNRASNHMTGDKYFFLELNKKVKGREKIGDGSWLNIEGKGQATEYGYVRMKEEHLTLYDSQGGLILKVLRSPNRLYKIKLKVCEPISLQSLNKYESWKSHDSRGQTSFKVLENMMKLKMIRELKEIEEEKKIYDAYLVGKQSREDFLKEIQFRKSEVNDDVLGLTSSPIHDQNRYMFVIINDYTIYTLIILKGKGEALERYKGFKMLIRKEIEKSSMSLRMEKEEEPISMLFQEICTKNEFVMSQRVVCGEITSLNWKGVMNEEDIENMRIFNLVWEERNDNDHACLHDNESYAQEGEGHGYILLACELTSKQVHKSRNPSNYVLLTNKWSTRQCAESPNDELMYQEGT